MIILDFGGGETCKNDEKIVKRMIDGLVAVDPREKEVIIKWQLFERVPAPVRPLMHDVFDYAYHYAAEKGYETTASVFDINNLRYLLKYDIPFVKIAARRKLYWLIKYVPKEISVVVSINTAALRDPLHKKYPNHNIIHLCCIPEYPASRTKYETMFGFNLSYSISDHTTNFDLYHEYNPWFYERHYRLPDSTGLDAGPFASTPAELEAILNE